MIYTLIAEQSSFGVDRDFRPIDLADLNPDIAVIQFDTVRNTGVVQWKSDVFDYVQTRDLAAEEAAYKSAVENNHSLTSLKPIYTRTPVRRQRKVIDSFEPFEFLISRWEASVPVPPEPPPAVPAEERVRLIEVVRLLRRKGILTAEDVEYLKSTVQET